ncbi:MAG: hypothetical protein DMG40_10935 [Acidobacteria bacterium]|nr:MAG: hypothetical protein DMG40_10935 [Acidobacteriota bacterium]
MGVMAKVLWHGRNAKSLTCRKDWQMKPTTASQGARLAVKRRQHLLPWSVTRGKQLNEERRSR